MISMKNPEDRLWNGNFTWFSISTFLTYLSMAAISFVLSLLVLDFTNSVLLYGTYLVLYYGSGIIVPMFAGPLIENRSKKHIIAFCNIATAIIYLGYLVLHECGIRSYGFILLTALLTGAIQAFYTVSVNALLLEVANPGKLQKAYSVLSTIEITSEVAAPVVAYLYKHTEVSGILAVTLPLLLVAALVGAFGIKVTDLFLPKPEAESYTNRLKEGLRFVSDQSSYFAVCIAFMLLNIIIGVRRGIWLPFFESLPGEAYLMYFVITGVLSTGMVHASALLYVVKIKKEVGYVLSVVCFLINGIGLAVALFCGNIGAMIIAYFAGLAYGIFKNLCSLTVFAGLDELQRARFSGIFTAFTNVGYVLGLGCSGLLSCVCSLTVANAVLCGLALVVFLFVYVLWGGKAVKQLFVNATEKKRPDH